MDSEGNHQRDAVSSQSLNDETIARTLTSPSLSTLPFDLVSEILCRLPVKLLLRVRCVCKSWNSLITDATFAKKQLRVSTVSLVHTLPSSNKYVLKSYPLDSVFANVTAKPIVQLEFPFNHPVYFVGSCNGILCLCFLVDFKGFISFLLWNPSTRKFRELPPLEKKIILAMYGFSYDAVTDNYKVVAVLQGPGNFVDNHEVKVHTLGTNSWKSIQKFPFGCVAFQLLGKYVSGTINWLVAKKYNEKIQRFIVSLDLGNESYKEILLPLDYGVVDGNIHLHWGVLRDCLCMVFGHDVWVMKEHGNKDSWTKLFLIPYMQNLSTSHANIEVINIFEDDQVLLKSANGWTRKLIL